jgi:hypothetical protein
MKALKRTSRALDNVFLFSMPKTKANMCFTEARSMRSWRLENVLQMWTKSTLSLKDLLEDAKLKDYIVNSFVLLASDGTLADAKDLLDKNPQCLDILVTQDGTKNGIVAGWITNVMLPNAATI